MTRVDADADAAAQLTTKINHLRYPSSVMNCLYVAFDVSSA